MTITRLSDSPVRLRIVKAAKPWRPDITRRSKRVATIRTEILGYLALASVYANQDDEGPVYLTLHGHGSNWTAVDESFRDDILQTVIAYLQS